MGFTAKLPPNRGGDRISAYKTADRITLHLHSNDKQILLTAGELELIAVLYDKIQELE